MSTQNPPAVKIQVILMVLFSTDKTTNPLNKETDWDSIKDFCDQLEHESDG